MIRGVFFDGGGVIAHFDEEVIRSSERGHGLAYGDVMDVLYSGTDWMDAERGALDEDEWIPGVARDLGQGVLERRQADDWMPGARRHQLIALGPA